MAVEEHRNRPNDLFSPHPRNPDAQVEQHYSLDKRFLMIHPSNLKKLTPSLRAPQISRQPSFKHIDFFDLQNPYHVEILC